MFGPSSVLWMTLMRNNASSSNTVGRSRMPELGKSGSVRYRPAAFVRPTAGEQRLAI
jgi:hypothetical protein